MRTYFAAVQECHTSHGPFSYDVTAAVLVSKKIAKLLILGMWVWRRNDKRVDIAATVSTRLNARAPSLPPLTKLSFHCSPPYTFWEKSEKTANAVSLICVKAALRILESGKRRFHEMSSEMCQMALVYILNIKHFRGRMPLYSLTAC